ncbi:MAG: S8 family serine peptidase [Roseibacillus sp.]
MSSAKTKWIATTLVVILGVAGGFWLARDIVGLGKDRTEKTAAPLRPIRQFDGPNALTKSEPRHANRRSPKIEDLLFGIPNERIVRFSSDSAYRNFLSKLDGKKLRLLGKLDALRAARVGYTDLDDLEDLLDDDDEAYGNYRVAIPELPQVDAQPGAVAFGRATLEWLGITGDNSSWGEGVRIAMLDTGVGQHAAFPEGIREIDLITGDGPPIDLHGHGTAVASLLVGSDDISQGIAPAAELLSIRIGDDAGASNSFLLAEGIVLAVDEGAQIINISMGSYGDSALVRDAIAYAADHQVVIIAAAGNEGIETPAYPAAYEGVIAVGAIDGSGQHLDFSNTGDSIDLAAPGYEIVSAWPDDQFTSFSGTSASSPIVVGAIAATMSELGPMPVGAATEIVMENLNAAGAPGEDPQYGEGNIDIGRVMQSETPGILDLAVASNWYEPPSESEVVGSLLVTVENRGTAAISGATIDVSIGSNIFPMTIASLQPGATQVLTLAVNAPTSIESITINSVLNMNGTADSDPTNNSLAGQIVLITESPSEVAAANPPLPTGPVTPQPDNQ